jgi:light-regulated signal transduction histidine kinase (bacteriophytochrome)
LRHNGPESVLAVTLDITERVRAEQALRASNEELQRANRGLEEFAHVASHDLQEPLRMVKSYAQLLIRRLGSEATEEQRQFAEFISSGVQRMEKLLKDLLAYSRAVHTTGELTTSKASLEEAVDHALTTVDSRIADTGAIITHDALPVVKGDVMQLSHVFQNLLSNALKYRKPNETPRIHFGAERRDGHWVVSVRDNGIGFERHQAERIFGLFVRLHREHQYPGTGLGLAICKRIVERFGGRIWAESEPGVGSTFYISLPVPEGG